MKKNKSKDYDLKTFPCDCTANKKCDKLVVKDFRDKDVLLDIWSGKILRGGVYLGTKSLKKLIKFLIKITK